MFDRFVPSLYVSTFYLKFLYTIYLNQPKVVAYQSDPTNQEQNDYINKTRQTAQHTFCPCIVLEPGREYGIGGTLLGCIFPPPTPSAMTHCTKLLQ